MVLDKVLILKGLAGVAALGGTIGSTIIFRKELGLVKDTNSPAPVDQTTDEYGIPTKCNSSNPCQLTIDELKNIKFKELDGDGDVTVEPSNPSPSITLSFVSSPSNKYTFNNTSTSAVTIKRGNGEDKKVTLDVGETEFTLESKKLKLYVDPKVVALNTKLTNLKLPEKCKFKNSEKTNTTKECEVTVEELKKVEFENKETDKELTVTGPTSGNIKIEIKRLKKETDAGQYGSSFDEDDLRFIFKEFTGQITISNSAGNSSIIIPEGSNTVFQMNSESKLNKSHGLLSTIPPNWGILCTPIESNTGKWDCTPYETNRAIKILNQPSGSFEELKGVENSKNIFTVDENTANYNQGYKFTVKETISGTSGSPSLTKDDTYEIKYVSGSWGLVKKS